MRIHPARPSLPAIARHFDRDHTTVLSATRRIEKTPPLRDLAAKIAADLPSSQPAASEPATSSSMSPSPVTAPPACESSSELVPVAAERPQLRVAR